MLRSWNKASYPEQFKGVYIIQHFLRTWTGDECHCRLIKMCATLVAAKDTSFLDIDLPTFAFNKQCV